jgi:hypothetical protein
MAKIIQQWNKIFSILPLIKEGSTEKATQFIILLKSVYNKSIYYNDVFLNTADRLQQ